MELEELLKELPERVVYTRTFTYNAKEVAQSWFDVHQTVMTAEEVLDLIRSYAEEDMRTPPSRHDFFEEEVYD